MRPLIAPRRRIVSFIFEGSCRGMGIAESRKVAMFSPLELDLRVAAMPGMIRVRMGQERKLGDDAGADNLTSFIALIDRD